MRLIDDHQEIIRKIVQKRTGRFPGSRSCQMAGIVLDSGAEPSFPHHFHVKIRPFRNPLRLQKLILALKKSDLLLHLRQDILGGNHHLFLRHHIMGGRKNRHMPQLRFHLAGQRINLHDPIYLIAEKLNPVSLASRIRGKYL